MYPMLHFRRKFSSGVTTDHPLPIIINREPEWEVEEILNSRWHRRRFQYLVKWKGYGCEHNSWESASEVSAPELVRAQLESAPECTQTYSKGAILSKSSV